MRCDACYAVASHTKALRPWLCDLRSPRPPIAPRQHTSNATRPWSAHPRVTAEGDDCAWAGVLHHAGGSKSEFSTTFTRCFFPITSSRCASSRALSHSSTSCTPHNPCLLALQVSVQDHLHPIPNNVSEVPQVRPDGVRCGQPRAHRRCVKILPFLSLRRCLSQLYTCFRRGQHPPCGPPPPCPPPPFWPLPATACP
jgi:hypothetical protein